MGSVRSTNLNYERQFRIYIYAERVPLRRNYLEFFSANLDNINPSILVEKQECKELFKMSAWKKKDKMKVRCVWLQTPGFIFLWVTAGKNINNFNNIINLIKKVANSFHYLSRKKYIATPKLYLRTKKLVFAQILTTFTHVHNTTVWQQV